MFSLWTFSRSYLKLYTSMPLEKLANYMNTTVDELECNLLCFKHKMLNIVWTKGTSALQGEFQSESEVTMISQSIGESGKLGAIHK